MSIEALAAHRRYRFSLVVYPNRIEVEETNTIGLKKKETVLLRNVASVDVPNLKTHVIVKTTDGRTYKWLCGRETEAVYQAIVGAL